MIISPIYLPYKLISNEISKGLNKVGDFVEYANYFLERTKNSLEENGYRLTLKEFGETLLKILAGLIGIAFFILLFYLGIKFIGWFFGSVLNISVGPSSEPKESGKTITIGDIFGYGFVILITFGLISGLYSKAKEFMAYLAFKKKLDHVPEIDANELIENIKIYKDGKKTMQLLNLVHNKKFLSNTSTVDAFERFLRDINQKSYEYGYINIDALDAMALLLERHKNKHQ